MTDAPLLLVAEQQEDLFGDIIGATPNIDREQLGAALAEIVVGMSLNDIVGIITNQYNELIEYIALSTGERAGQKISLLFNPHRLDTRTSSSTMSIYQALKTPQFHSGLARATLFKRGKVSELFYQAIQLGINGIQYVNEFPPYVARDICRQYGLTTTSAVLDPCAGWGGRLIGCSVTAGIYVGYEPATKTADGLCRLADFIAAANHDFAAEIICQPYEDSSIQPDWYDLALTSPPYYNTEIYTTEPTNSLNRYDTFEDWCKDFYLPLIDKTMRQLKPAAPFILNIGDRKWPLSTVLRDHAADKYAIRNLGNKLSGMAGLGKENTDGETFYEIRNLK